MANYDYETALMLIDQETPIVPLLYQKGKALKGLGNNLEALSVFQEVVVQDSLNPRAYRVCRSVPLGDLLVELVRYAVLLCRF